VTARHRIVAINWRDIRNPDAGGAEVHLHEILRRLVERGHGVSQLSAGWPDAPAEETVDGVHLRRAGRWWNANFALAHRYIRDRWAERCDVVVEDINKIPFYSPVFARRPVLAVVPHLFGTTVFQETAWPMAAYVYCWEALIPRVYARCQVLAISESTRDDLVGRGLERARIHVSFCGLDHAAYTPGRSAPEPGLVVFLGRLQRYKGVQHALRAMMAVRSAVPHARLVVVGKGPYRGALEDLALSLGLGDAVEFRGHVSTADKVDLLRRAVVVVNPSPKEGWGLTSVEAAACGTPVVASDSPGLRESVRHGETGFLVPHGDVAALADRTIEVLRNEVLRARFSHAAIEWAGRFTWERAADDAESLIDQVARGAR
jgi:glycosyltransferase involved in cell wall biosynthesis